MANMLFHPFTEMFKNLSVKSIGQTGYRHKTALAFQGLAHLQSKRIRETSYLKTGSGLLNHIFALQIIVSNNIIKIGLK